MAKKFIVTSAKCERKMKEMQEEQKRLQYKLSDRQRRFDSYSRKLGDLECDPTEDLEELRNRVRQFEVDLADALAEQESLEKKKSNLEASIVDALSEHLDNVNGKAYAHVLSASEVIALAEEAELTLSEKGVTAKNRVGSEFEFRPAGKEANATYARKAGPQITTFVKMLRVTDGWRLVEAHRDNAWCNQKAHWQLTVSMAARDNIVCAAMDSIFIHSDEVA